MKWVHAHSAGLNVDAKRIIVAGESGGGNLTRATGLKLKRDGDLGLIKGLYALCPYISGEWPLPQYPSSIENNGILIDLHNNRGAMAYGIEAFRARNPLAWPAFATAEDITGFPPTVISVNECDPLRDEGIGFYQLLIHNGIRARCRQVMGTIHGTEIFQPVALTSVTIPPLISRTSVRAEQPAPSASYFVREMLSALAASSSLARLLRFAHAGPILAHTIVSHSRYAKRSLGVSSRSARRG